MALPTPFDPPPNTPLVTNASVWAQWARWFWQIWNRVKSGALGGTVTSVGLSLPTSVFDVSGSPVTSSGTLTATFDNQAANTVFAGPASGSPATPTFRTLSGADVTLTVGTTPIASGTAGRLLYEGPGNVLQESAGMSFDGTTLAVTGLNNTGNTVEGDNSSDTLTTNWGTWTIGSNYTATRSVGTLGSGNNDIFTNIVEGTGNASGTSNFRGFVYRNDFQGSVNANTIDAYSMNARYSGTGTANLLRALRGEAQLTSSGNATEGNCFVATATTSSTGAFSTLVGYQTSTSLGNSTLITNTIGFNAVNITANPTLVVGFRSQQSSGTGKWGFLHTSTANNAFNGPTRFGSGTVVPVAQVDVLQATLGNQVFALSSTATNDDPNEIVRQQKVTTIDATTTTIATIAIPSTTTVMIEARVTARRTGGTSGTEEDGASYIIAASYKNVAGTATEIAESTLFTAEDQPGWNCTFTPSGSNALLQVTGAANNNVSWIVTYRTYSLSS